MRLYELIATQGPATVLLGYTRQKTRDTIFGILAKHAAKIVPVFGTFDIVWGATANDGGRIGEWEVRFTGRTQDEAEAEGKHQWLGDVEPQYFEIGRGQFGEVIHETVLAETLGTVDGTEYFLCQRLNGDDQEFYLATINDPDAPILTRIATATEPYRSRRTALEAFRATLT